MNEISETETLIASVKVITPRLETPSGDSFINVGGDTTNFGNNFLQLDSPNPKCYIVSKMFNVTTSDCSNFPTPSSWTTTFYPFTIPSNTVLNVSLQSAIGQPVSLDPPNDELVNSALLNTKYRIN